MRVPTNQKIHFLLTVLFLVALFLPAINPFYWQLAKETLCRTQEEGYNMFSIRFSNLMLLLASIFLAFIFSACGPSAESYYEEGIEHFKQTLRRGGAQNY